MVEEPPSELEALYSELVGDRERALAAAMQGQMLPSSVAEVFGRLEAQRKVWKPPPIMLPTVRQRFKVPFAYQNGRVNYVRPESLAPGGKLDDRMARLGFNGQLIYNHLIDNTQGQLVVLSADPEADASTERRFGEALREFSVRFVPNAEAEEYAAEVERTAH